MDSSHSADLASRLVRSCLARSLTTQQSYCYCTLLSLPRSPPFLSTVRVATASLSPVSLLLHGPALQSAESQRRQRARVWEHTRLARRVCKPIGGSRGEGKAPGTASTAPARELHQSSPSVRGGVREGSHPYSDTSPKT